MEKWIISRTDEEDTVEYYTGDINTYEDSWNTTLLIATLFPSEIAAVRRAIESPATYAIDIKKVKVNV